MKKNRVVALASLAVLLAGGVAHAQPSRQRDGGDLTREQAPQRADSRFERMDANADGLLNEADREARQHVFFKRLDGDGNGAVTFGEFAAAHEYRRETRVAHRTEGDELRGRGPMRGGHSGSMAGIGRMAGGADADGDAAIGQAEFRAAALERFDWADANHDGTAEESRALRREMRAARRT